MAGHSKWANRKHKKAREDAKRSKAFTKIIKEIVTAARLGGSNETTNPRLKVAVQKAKDVNMPSKNIERARLKGAGELPGVNIEEVTYEGYGPGGIAVIVECLTDNKQRTVADVRHLFSRSGGNLGENGSVSWMFNKKGRIVIALENLEEDAVMEDVLECGAEDMEVEEDYAIVYTPYEKYLEVCNSLSEKYEFEDNEILMIADNYLELSEEHEDKFIRLIDELDELDDVSDVYYNTNID